MSPVALHAALIRNAIILSAAFIAGCSAGPATQSGFLSDYSGLTQAGKSQSLLRLSPPPGFDPTRYDSVMVERPIIMVEGLAQKDSDQLSTVFAEALEERLGAGRRIVTRSGPRTLRVRAAVTRTTKANVPLNVLSSLVLAPVTKGGVAAEAEVLDGATGARIAAMSWSRRGAKIIQPGLAYTRLGESRAGLRSFAGRLADMLDGKPKDRDAR